MEKQKEVGGLAKIKGNDKKVAKFEGELRDLNRDMSIMKMKSGFVVAITLISLVSFMNQL